MNLKNKNKNRKRKSKTIGRETMHCMSTIVHTLLASTDKFNNGGLSLWVVLKLVLLLKIVVNY